MSKPVPHATMHPTMTKLTLPLLDPRPLTAGEKAAIVNRIDELLELRYRSRTLGNYTDPLEEAIYIILSRQTRETGYQRAYRALRTRWPTWPDVMSAAASEIEIVIAPAGFGKQRATQIKKLLETVAQTCNDRGLTGQVTLDWLRTLNDADAEAFLLTLPGLGPKSARCVMHYALDRNSFAVDTNIKRIFHRLGLVADSASKVDHHQYEQLVPSEIRQRLHINLIHHGREVCRNAKPACHNCSLISFCHAPRPATTNDRNPVAVELFAGGGGMGAGFAEAGYRIAVAVEWDRDAAQTYRLNHPGTIVLEADVRHVAAENIRRLLPADAAPEVLIAGPPCQGYSAAGKRDAKNERNKLFLEVGRLARELRPRFVVIENVPGMRAVGGVRFTTAVLQELETSDYAAAEYMLRACDYGVPQLRHRILFLAQGTAFGHAPPKPTPTHCPGDRCTTCDLPTDHSCGLPQTPTVMQSLATLPPLGPGQEAENLPYGSIVVFNGSTMKHSQKVINKISAIEPGTGPISYRRLHPDLARTIVAGHRALPVHPEFDRTISVREAARIQGFLDDHIFCGARQNQPLQVANAVPPALALAVARELRDLTTRPSENSDQAPAGLANGLR